MGYTFNEGIQDINSLTMSGQYPLKYDDAIQIINTLKKEYAPTVEMTKQQYKGLLFEGKGRETAHKNFVFMRDVQELNDGYISIDTLMNAFVHPETIKVIDEENK